MSVDPLTHKFPFYSPYQYAGNKPIQFIDLDGAEEATPAEPGKTNENGTKSGGIDNARAGQSGETLDKIAHAPKGDGKPPSISDAITLKLTIGGQVGLDANLFGKKPVQAEVNLGSKDLIGISEGEGVYLGQKDAPTYSGAGIGFAGFSASSQEKATTTETPRVGIFALPTPTKKVTEKTGAFSYGIFSVNTSQTTTTFSGFGGTTTTTSPFHAGSTLNFNDAAKSKIGVKASFIIGIEASVDVPLLLRGIGK
jgi:hypothetical protein